MNKAQILKQTGLTEQEFYKLYPTQQHYQMAMGGRLYADGGGLPPDGGTSYIQYDEEGNPITANQMYGNKQVNIPASVKPSNSGYVNPEQKPTSFNMSEENQRILYARLAELDAERERLLALEKGSTMSSQEEDIKPNSATHFDTRNLSKEERDANFQNYWKDSPDNPANQNKGSYDNLSFNEAFGKARKDGLTKFTWKGKSYGTKLKGESTSSNVRTAPAVVSEIEGAPKRMALGGVVEPVPPTVSLPYKPSVKVITDKQGRVLPSNMDALSPQVRAQASMTREHQKVNQYRGGGDIENPKPVVHTGTASNKTWLESGLDYLGNLGVQDFSNKLQSYGNNYNNASLLYRNNPSIGSKIPAVKNYNSSNIKPLYIEQYAGGGNLAGDLDQQGIQNEQMNSNTVYVPPAAQGIMGFGQSIANALGLGSITSSAIDSLGSKAGIKGSKAFNTGMGVGTGLTTVAGMAAGIAGMPGVSGGNNEFDPNKTTGNSLTGGAGSSAGDLLNNQAYGGRLRYAAGGALTEINTGGTHEQNPMGGVMVGKNASVEQGEALINKDGKPKFVLTDRIKLDSTTAQEFDLPKKYIGKTFSEIGKAENKVSDLRPEDPLTKDLVKSRNAKLEAAQEAQKAKMAEKHMAKAQELAPEMFQQAQPQEQIPQGMPQEQMAMQDPGMEQMMAMQGQGMPQGMPQQPMMAWGGGFDPIEPVMMNTNTYPSIPSIQNVPIVSDPNALRDLQQRDRSIDATLNWEKNNNYNNYGFTSEPAGSINSLGQAHEKFMDIYQPMIDDLPMGLQGLAGDFAFNSEDPRASLMVSQGYITPQEKVALYKNGKLDNTAVDKLWATHGTNVKNNFNGDRVAFANNFDAERLRSYKNTKGADEKLPEWTRRVADSRNASGIPLTNPLITQDQQPLFRKHSNPWDKLKKSPREFEGVPPNINPPGKQELKDILLSETKIPKDRTGLKAAILGTQAAMEAARIAATKKPVDFRNVNFTETNSYIPQAIMQANKNNDIANYRDVLRNAGASQAQYIGNATQTFPAMSADYASKIALMRYQADQANNQIANSEEQMNQRIQAENIERKAQGEANQSNQFGNLSAGLVQNTLPLITEKEKRDMQLATMGMMDTAQYSNTYDDKTGIMKRTFKPSRVPENITKNAQIIYVDNKPHVWSTDLNKLVPVGTGAYGGKITKKKFGGSMKNC